MIAKAGEPVAITLARKPRGTGGRWAVAFFARVKSMANGEAAKEGALAILKSLPTTFILVNIFALGVLYSELKHVSTAVASIQAAGYVQRKDLDDARATAARDVESLRAEVRSERLMRHADNQLISTYIQNAREKLAERGFRLPPPPVLGLPAEEN